MLRYKLEIEVSIDETTWDGDETIPTYLFRAKRELEDTLGKFYSLRTPTFGFRFRWIEEKQ